AAFKLPAGLVGNATLIPQCSEQDFGAEVEGGINSCPEDTAVGVVLVTIDEPANLKVFTRPVPLFNLVPSHGEPARFGFAVLNGSVTFDASVRSGGDYGVTINVNNLTEVVNPIFTQSVFWGVPGDPSHDESRGWGCVAGGYYVEVANAPPCQLLGQVNPKPLLTLPTSCSLPFAGALEGDSWPTKSDPQGLQLVPKEYSLTDNFGREVGLTGCDQLPFSPSIQVAPDTNAASTPTGLSATVHIPQDTSASREGLAEAALKDTTVVLPEGVQIN